MAKKKSSPKPKATKPEAPKAVSTAGVPSAKPQAPAPKKSSLLKVKDMQSGAVARMKHIAYENVKNEVFHREGKEQPRYKVIEGE